MKIICVFGPLLLYYLPIKILICLDLKLGILVNNCHQFPQVGWIVSLDNGPKTILPSTALAKLDFRLVPDMDPKTQFNRLKTHLKRNGFGDLIEIGFIHGERAYRTSIDSPMLTLVKDSAAEAFGTNPIKSNH